MQKQGRLLLVGLIVVLVGVGLYFVLQASSKSQPVTINVDDAQAQIDAGQYDAARDALEELVATDPENAEAHFMLGLTYFNLGEYDKAKASFSQAMTLEPERAAAVHHNLGVLAYQTGEMETAVAEFKAALEADPNDPDSHYQLGATYLQIAISNSDLMYLQQAETEFEQVLALAPGKPEALVGLGTLYLNQNRAAEAIDLLEQAVQSNPEMREALFALGMAYFASGDTASAKETLQKFLDTQPPEQWANEAREIMNQLGE
ncbi:MAG: tetratricopeptide repeat protein [Anaerolineae bacterium]|nr:tetratricopeptide repeat protein [Anaerolineae bacterium]